MPRLDEVSVELTALNDRFHRGMTAARGDLQQFGDRANTVSNQAEAATSRLESGFNRVKVAVGAMLAGFAVERLVSFGREAASFADELLTVATNAGTTAEKLQMLRYAAKQGNVEAAAFDDALLKLQRQIGQVAAGASGPAADAFRQYGIAIEDQNGIAIDTTDVLVDVAEAIKNAGTEAERTRIATALFGRTGADLVPILREGADGLVRLGIEAREAGAVMSNEMVAAGAALDESFTKLSATIDTQLKEALINLGPVLEVIIGGIALLARVANATASALAAVWEEAIAPSTAMAPTDPTAALASMDDQSITELNRTHELVMAYRDQLSQDISQLTEANEYMREQLTGELRYMTESIARVEDELRERGVSIGTDIDLTVPDVSLGGGGGRSATDAETAATRENTRAQQESTAARELRTRSESLMQEVMRATTTEQEAYNEKMRELQILMITHPEIAERARAYQAQLTAEFAETGNAMLEGFRIATKGIGQLFRDLADESAGVFDDIRAYALNTINNILDNMMNAFGNQVGDWVMGGIFDLVGSLAGGAGGGGGGLSSGGRSGASFGHATGGPMVAGAMYEVGERGREFIRSGTTGRVISDPDVGGSAPILSVTQNIDASGSGMTEQRLRQVTMEAAELAYQRVLSSANRGGDAAKVIGRRRK